MSRFTYSLSVLLLMAISGTAATIGNGPPDQSGGAELNAFIGADDFTLATAQNLTNIRFWSLEGAGAYLGSITWALLSDVAGTPGSTLFTGSAASVGSATGNSVGPFAEFQYDISIAVSNLAAGTYWLSLHNGPLASTSPGDFYWAYQSSVAGNSMGYDLVTPGPWASNFAELAFEITTNDPTGVPEPGTVGLISAGIAATAMVRRRKKQ